MPDPVDVWKDANESSDGRYRYWLTRIWGTGPAVCWIMLNPSSADAVKDDPTIRRVMQFTEAWGYHAFTVVNLFPLRTADPRKLRVAPYSGEHVVVANWSHIKASIESAGLVVAAWGANKVPGRNVIVNEVVMAARHAGASVWCLGVTADGSPRHPSPLGRVPMDTEPQLWRSFTDA